MFERNRNNKQGSPKIEETRKAPEAPVMSSRPAVSSSQTSAVIGPGIEISGEVHAKADLVVHGKIQGSIVQGTQSVEIGEPGQVFARIRAKMVRVSGEVRGDIIGEEKVLISRTGRVLGNISAPRVQLDDGALFKGSIDMTPPQAAKPATPATEKVVEPAKPATPAGKKESSAPTSGSTAQKSTSGKEQERKEPSLTLKSG